MNTCKYCYKDFETKELLKKHLHSSICFDDLRRTRNRKMNFVNCGWCNKKLGFPKEDWEWEYWRKALPICNQHWTEKEFSDRMKELEK